MKVLFSLRFIVLDQFLQFLTFFFLVSLLLGGPSFIGLTNGIESCVDVFDEIDSSSGWLLFLAVDAFTAIHVGELVGDSP